MKTELPQSPRLSNEDLLPDTEQKWGWYSIFAFWMSDVHSVGGYVFAASLFALGLNGIQVLISLLVGISIVLVFANMMGQPGQKAGAPFPVIARMSFGVFGANIPAVIRGLIAVVWYGIQTYLASSSFIILLLYFFPRVRKPGRQLLHWPLIPWMDWLCIHVGSSGYRIYVRHGHDSSSYRLVWSCYLYCDGCSVCLYD